MGISKVLSYTAFLVWVISAIEMLCVYVIKLERLQRWSDNFQRIASLKQAIAECGQNNNGVFNAAPCNAATGANSLASAGFLDPTYALPTSANLTSVTWNGTLMTLNGAAPAGSCVVTITPSVGAGQAAINWATANGVGCGRSKTGVGT